MEIIHHDKEAQIRKLEERNRKIIEAMPEFIFIFDDHCCITDVMMAENTVLFHTREELVGADVHAIYAPEVCDLFTRNIHACLTDGKLREIEYYLDTKTDGRHFFQARIAPFEDGKVLALIHDIGDRVQRSMELIEAKRKAEESDRMKSIFLANMSHEIRTPLNAIVGFSEILITTSEEEEKELYIKIIRENSNLLLQLINDILDLSRIESGKTEMFYQPLEVGALMEEVGKVYKMKLPQGVKLEVLRPARDLIISTDRNRVTQVLFNFMSNAIKNTQSGCITIGVEKAEECIKLYVRDTGRGIPEDRLASIFNRFEKVNAFVQGTGLGLPICKSIADRLGGDIEVQSVLGEGSTFSLVLPYWEQKKEEDSEEDAEMRRRRHTILVVEDVEANFMLLNGFLKKDYTLLWAMNGEEGVNCYIRERPDLIIMDIKMPVMNGVEAIGRIRNISPEVPIIAVTEHTYYTESEMARNAGCNEVIPKPYDIDNLKEMLAKFLVY
ncbi:ATP-binding protein [Phocaeicola sp.]